MNALKFDSGGILSAAEQRSLGVGAVFSKGGHFKST